MEVIDLNLQDVKLIQLKVFSDVRGFFCECYRAPIYKTLGIDCDFVQDNYSFSKKGTIRGMHFQRYPGQAKLVSVLSGTIFDVVVDIRPDSQTFGKWQGIELKAEEGKQIFIPSGFAHGFCVLSDSAHVFYKVSSLYDPAEERGFLYNDPRIAIHWPVSSPILSDRDLMHPLFEEVVS